MLFRQQANEINLRDCVKASCVKFEASHSPRENSCGGGTLDVLQTRLDMNLEIDKVNITYDLMHPETSRRTHNGAVYFDYKDDIYSDNPLKFIPENVLEVFKRQIKMIFDDAQIEYDFRCQSLRSHPGYWPLSRGGYLPPDVGNPMTEIKVSFDIKHAESVAAALERAGFDMLPGNEIMVSEIRGALEKIQEHKNKNISSRSPGHSL